MSLPEVAQFQMADDKVLRSHTHLLSVAPMMDLLDMLYISVA
jgi:hypothetical protein